MILRLKAKLNGFNSLQNNNSRNFSKNRTNNKPKMYSVSEMQASKHYCFGHGKRS